MSTNNNVFGSHRRSSNKPWSPLKRAMMLGIPGRFKFLGKTKKSGRKRFESDWTDSSSQGSQGNDDVASAMPELPSVLWTDVIFFFLDRSGQNRLAQAHPDVALRRRQHWHAMSSLMDWPRGKIFKASRPVIRVDFSPDSQQLCVVSAYKSQAVIYDKFTGLQHKLKANTNGPLADAKFSPDGSMLATAGQSDGTIRLWKQSESSTDPSSEKKTSDCYSCFQMFQVRQYDLCHLKWSPHNDVICSWGHDGLVRVTDIQDGTVYARHWKTRRDVSPDCHETVAFGPGNIVAYARDNDRVHLWNWKTNNVQLLRDLHRERGTQKEPCITSLAYSPDGRKLVVGFQSGIIKVWKIKKCNPQESHGREYDYVFAKELSMEKKWCVTLLTFTPDGRYLACTDNGYQIRVIDTIGDRIVATWKGHSSRIESLCFTADGRTLASCARDRSVQLWDNFRLRSCGV